MANGKLSIKQLTKIMDEARIDAERDLSAATNYEDFLHAAGRARGFSSMIHSVILAVFGLPHDSLLAFNPYTDFAAYINQRIEFHLGRFTGVGQ